MLDEGFTDGDAYSRTEPVQSDVKSVKEREDLAYRLLASLPRSRLADIQRRIAPLLQFDVVGSLPTEVALQIFGHLTYDTLLQCTLVSRRWQALADDQSLWKKLCRARGWEWKQPSRGHGFQHRLSYSRDSVDDSDDEGMGDSDEEGEVVPTPHADSDGDVPMADDSGFVSRSFVQDLFQRAIPIEWPSKPSKSRPRHHSAPSILPSANTNSATPKPNYKLLYQTHIRLHHRFLSGSYRLSSVQIRGAPSNAHTNTIYCLQLYTYPATGVQVLFTGSRDRSIREWDLSTGLVQRVISGVHDGSVLSICVADGLLASAGSDRKVAVWDLEADNLTKVICDHEDSVLCVRFDKRQLVSCSKDRTVRTYTFPELKPRFVLGAHRAAVNAVSISQTLIVSGSGDRSIRLWDARTGDLLRTFDNHHTRGIASIDFKPPYVLSGSSDKHLRLFDITSLQGWSTSPEYEHSPPPSVPFAFPWPFGMGGAMPCTVCHACGSTNGEGVGGVGAAGAGGAGGTSSGAGASGEIRRGSRTRRRVGDEGCMHGDLVRSVVLGEHLVLSGSYDMTIKMWDRATGALVADLTGGHTGRIFCIGFDSTKIVSCGEDQRICIWDFSHGIDTSFVRL